MRCFAKPGSSKFELPRFPEAQIRSSNFELPEFSCRWLEMLYIPCFDFKCLSHLAVPKLKWTWIMLVSSALRRSRTSHGSSSGSIGSSLPKATSSEVVPAAITCLRSAFPQGFKESLFNGTENEIGETHCAFLQKWYQLKCGADESRKAFKCAFPGLGDAVVNSAISKVSAVKSFVFRKHRNAKTGERMASWVKEIYAVLEPSEKKKVVASSSLQKADTPKGESAHSSSKVQILPCENESEDLEAADCISVDSTSVAPSVSTQVASLVEKPETSEKVRKRPGKSPATGQQVKKKTCNPKAQPVLEGKPFFWVCEMHQGYQQVLHSVQENHG